LGPRGPITDAIGINIDTLIVHLIEDCKAPCAY
jgi:hypothetical protein